MTEQSVILKDATISECGRYRYTLGRAWGVGHMVNFIMLNPSTADATEDDPTIRRCVGFAKSWGFGRMVVTNLFAWRATDPDDLPNLDYVASGPENDRWIDQISTSARMVVCA